MHQDAPYKWFPLNVIEIFSMCEENHSTEKFLCLPYVKVLYQGEEGVEKIFFINQRRPQGPRPYQQGMQGINYPPSFSTSHNENF